MKVCDRTNCSFQKWYPLFKKHTFQSVVEKVPPEVLSYLNEDGIVLPIEAVSRVQPCQISSSFENNSDNDGVADTPDTCSEGTENILEPSFPEFSKKLADAIRHMGGNVFIKANWSAPTDASWIIPNKSLKCSSIEDMYLLLNTSSRLLRDFESLKEKDLCYLVIKKWEDIHPSTEFRCFVYDRFLIGISQRDCSDFHSYIPEAKMDIIRDVTEFFNQILKNTYPLQNYTFDIVRLSTGKIILVDFGVFDKKYSKSYLFTWEELSEIAVLEREIDLPEFRYVSSAIGVQPTDTFTGFGIPYDLTDVMTGQQVIDSLIGLIESEIKAQEEE
ncbi:translation initiation factor eIF2 assembly protein-like isoform X2 [Lycorma delicatula]|uniref:translation initiation factor eIF2 assembly protein-like isoform X2 n=1 Tax=Lycorma delicatula TaxID=130591 RepID=UPI003F50DD41